MQNWTTRWLLTFLIISTCYAGGTLRVQAARPTELFFSEYLEGSSNNKALEIFNGTGTPINLAGNGYNIQFFFNGATTAGLTIPLTGTVANDDVYVIAHSSANAAEANQTNGSSWFNGDDAIVLRKGTTIIDVIGQVGFDPGSAWGSGLISTVDHTLRRKVNICGGDTNSGNAFDPSPEWESFPNDTFAGLGSHASLCASEPTIVSINPTGGATNVATNTNLTITFSEPVNMTGIWLSLVGQTSGSHGANVSGGPVSYTIDPDRDFASG
jgi:predicted extracellular nuclease